MVTIDPKTSGMYKERRYGDHRIDIIFSLSRVIPNGSCIILPRAPYEQNVGVLLKKTFILCTAVVRRRPLGDNCRWEEIRYKHGWSVVNGVLWIQKPDPDYVYNVDYKYGDWEKHFRETHMNQEKPHVG